MTDKSQSVSDIQRRLDALEKRVSGIGRDIIRLALLITGLAIYDIFFK